MKPVTEPGKFASWIAPPRVGIDNKPGDFEYVKIAAVAGAQCPGVANRDTGHGPKRIC